MVRVKDDKKKNHSEKTEILFYDYFELFYVLDGFILTYLLTYFFCYEQEKCLKVKTHFLKLFKPT